MSGDFLAALSAEGLASSPFSRFMHLEFLPPSAPGAPATIRVPFSDNLRRQDHESILHGGVLAALVDLGGAWAIANTGVVPGPTMSARTDFLRPAPAEEHTVIARVLDMGDEYAVTDVRIESASGKVVATGRMRYARGTH